jgi:DNA-directed RNA polymerase subunit RPC12/RpoP
MARPFVDLLYVCDICGEDTWRESVSLPGDDAGTKTRCLECHRKFEGRSMTVPRPMSGPVKPLVGRDGSLY